MTYTDGRVSMLGPLTVRWDDPGIDGDLARVVELPIGTVVLTVWVVGRVTFDGNRLLIYMTGEDATSIVWESTSNPGPELSSPNWAPVLGLNSTLVMASSGGVIGSGDAGMIPGLYAEMAGGDHTRV